MSSGLPTGQRVLVHALADNPEAGVTHGLALEPQSAPDVSTLKPHEVLIGVKSVAISWVDLLMTSGQYQHMPTLPYSPGLEYSGDVLWAGAEVPGEVAATGTKVFVDCFNTGPRTTGPYSQQGGFASYAIAPAKAVHRIPGPLNYDQACNFAGGYETAYYCLVTRGRLACGETVMINGATGSTGLAAVQIAKRLGATVIATGRSMEKLAPLKEYGADHLVAVMDEGSKEIRRFRDDVKALTDGRGVDVVYDGVGGAVSLESLRCCRFGARFLIVGWASTPLVAKGRGGRGAPNANQLPTNLVLMKGLEVLGSPMIIGTQHDPAIREPRLTQLLEWAEEGALTPLVTRSYPLTEAKEALLAKWRGEITGGAVLHPPALDRGR